MRLLRKEKDRIGKKYTDEEVLEFINTANVFSDVLLDIWFRLTPEEKKKFQKK